MTTQPPQPELMTPEELLTLAKKILDGAVAKVANSSEDIIIDEFLVDMDTLATQWYKPQTRVRR